ncbi:MAG: hypothetical protein PV340_02840 [Wolbachia sp.]|nr:hypothetical protein [Wolbachia sp.]MDD9335881.1 hypothetical protein [Wolbachia sp.]
MPAITRVTTNNNVTSHSSGTTIAHVSSAAINPMSTRIQESIEFAARFERALEKGEEKGWGKTQSVTHKPQSFIEVHNLINQGRIEVRPTSITDDYMSFSVKKAIKVSLSLFLFYTMIIVQYLFQQTVES